MGARDQRQSDGGRTKNSRIREISSAPWERQPKERLVDFEGFVVYRDMSNRSVEAVGIALGKKADSFGSTSQRWKWVDRALAWDNELDRRVREAEADALVKMRERQINIALGMQTAAGSELKALVDTVKSLDAQAEMAGIKRAPFLKMRDLVRMIEAGTKLERLNRDQPSDIIEGTGTVVPIAPGGAQVVMYWPKNGNKPKGRT